jgi:putative ABC transport system permease protein
VYLKTKATYGAQGDMRFIWILTGLALFILVLAVTNFINLFMTHGQMRMNEIGIRKSNGAQMADIVRQFFSEVALIVLIAYILGFVLAVACVPHFAVLIGKNIDLVQLLNPLFIISAAVLFVLTVFLSAFYPALYLSRFSPLEIFGKRIRFSKRRLTASVVVFQSAIAIILLSVILVLYRQTVYLQELPLGYNPDNVMVFPGNNTINSSYGAIRQDLLNYPEVKDVRGSHHIFGSGSGSGQVIARWEDRDNRMLINEYRMMPGLPEMMELKTAEGRFWREDDPDSILTLVINEAAVKMLGDESPLEKTYFYHGIQARVIGVVKDFCYDNPAAGIAPMLFSRIYNPATFNIRFNEGVSRIRARELTEEAIRRIDPAFVLSPMWSADIYSAKFKAIKTVTLIVLLGSLIAIFVAMLGLLAIHLFSAMRRTKEIGIRRIHGAERSSVFLLLSLDVLKWIGYAAVFAIPAAVYFISRILDSYASHVSPDWTIFVLPAFAQCVIALLATSGVSLSVLKRNPIESLKSE